MSAPVGPSAGKRNLTDVMATLYAEEINCGCASFWDGGFEVWLGDQDYNGIKAARSFWPNGRYSDHPSPDFADAGEWLWEQAVKEYPSLSEVA